ncbi:dynein axonemal intermediate chain 1-like [Daphnia pulicaria]|uniref:dynein axonemal intermediate chain 1-like n=1 Tax=Daphnia pulicaria TaxID=35523 RepID=UPI001EEBC031|nr:dynein axonemal intermediate chain 1-like [Daphnia pulicaria]
MSVKVKLVESPTIWLLKIDSDCFITESVEISKENQLELTDLTPNVKCCGKSTQTITALQISEKEQTFPLIMNDQDAQATVWDLYDSYRFTEEEEEEREEGEEPSFEEKMESTVSKLTSLGRSLSSIEIAPLWAEMVGVIWPRDPLQRVEVEDGLRFKLEWKMIWSDENQFTKVNCVACNPQDRMLFAVAYQNLNTHKGFITCWNVQNVTYPELVISTSTNPTTVKFSIDNPRLIAVGDESGMVRFISISASSGHIAENRVQNSGHKGSVLDLCWVGCKVLSSGSDGRVLMWTTVTAELALESQVIAELEPSYYHLELPRLIELTLLSQPDCLPTPAARCCVAPLKSDPDRFIIGSEDGSLHTFSFLQNYVPLMTTQRHVGALVHMERIDYEDKEYIITLGNDNMIYVEMLLPGQKSQVTPLFPEPLASFS